MNILGKVFNRILNERLKNWVGENNILVAEQAEFCEGFSTVDNIVLINNIIEKQLQVNGGKLYACFIDFEKAFDLVDRNVLWEKLTGLRISSKVLKLLKSIYRKVEMKMITGEGYITKSFYTKKGVRKGCQLSPLLFSFFINDIFKL